ncbi:hypothetical protein C1141_20940, partial [Vibrio agarivorans]
MFKKTLILTLGVIFFSPVVLSFNDEPRTVKRCDEDNLTPTEAIQRNSWARKCRHISLRTEDYNVFDDNGVIRARPKYPSFFNPNNFDDWFKAPKSENAACDIRHYTRKIYCVSNSSRHEERLVRRCAVDSLNPIEAIQRNQWARKCKYISDRTF